MDNSQNIFEILKEIVFFDNLTDPQLKKISKAFTKETFLMGDQISVGDQELDHIRILINGEVREIVEHPELKKILTLNIEKPISLIGLNSSSGKNPCELISAATDCVFLKIKVKQWESILSKFPDILIHVNEKVRPSNIWEIIRRRTDIGIPEKSKDLKRWIRILTEKACSITVSKDKNIIKNLDSSKEWFLASVLDRFDSGTIINNEILNLIISHDKSIRIIGLPKKLFLKSVEDELEESSFIKSKELFFFEGN